MAELSIVPGSAPPVLTRRERDVVAALCRPALNGDVFTEAASVRDIARELVVTDAAVKQHLLRLYDKFGIHDVGERRRTRLAKEAIRRGAALAPAAIATQIEVATRASADSLPQGREAFEHRDWENCWRLLSEADLRRALEADDLEKLGEAGYWSNHHEESYLAQQRAHLAHVRRGDYARAAQMALMLAIHYVNRMEFAVGGGWLAKAQRLLDDEAECPAHGLLSLVGVLFKEAEGDWTSVLDGARSIFELGRRCRNADLQALGLTFQGLALTHQGEVSLGTKLLDEAMAAALGGELGAMATGLVYCRMLCACLDLQDYGRAFEWCRVIDRRVDEVPRLRGLPGDCRMHRAAIYTKHGAWAQAEADMLSAATEAEALDLHNAGRAYRELGDVRLRLGDIEGAEMAFLRAKELGAVPEPGMSMILLSRGDIKAASVALEASLTTLPEGALDRTRFLPAWIDVALAMGATETARTAVTELEVISAVYATPALLASAALARGQLAMATGELSQAIERLQTAQELWRRVEAPFEVAQAAQFLAQAHLMLGNSDEARTELRIARATLERLGAGRALDELQRLFARTLGL